jgi:membrane protein YdbS with pleckstrin-like domain
MAKRVFRSKVDSWFRVVIVFVIATELGVIVGAAVSVRDPLTTTGIILGSLAVLALLLSVLLNTSYTVDRGVLRARSGPLCWKVPVDQIQSVEMTRSPLSSPALSLDRLRIRYGKGRFILVSPADKAGFLRAIGQDDTEIVAPPKRERRR